MKHTAGTAIVVLLLTWPASPGAQDTGMLSGLVQVKRAAVVFLEESGHEQFGKTVGKTTELPRGTPADTRRATLNQIKLTFVPHVLAVERGTVIDFVNSDDVLHNIHLYRGSDMKTLHNLAMPLKGMKVSYRFDVPEEVIVLCDVHSEMSAYILVLPNKHFAALKADGRVDMKGLQPGTYVIKVWQEGMKKVEQTTVTIKPGVNALTLAK